MKEAQVKVHCGKYFVLVVVERFLLVDSDFLVTMQTLLCLHMKLKASSSRLASISRYFQFAHKKNQSIISNYPWRLCSLTKQGSKRGHASGLNKRCIPKREEESRSRKMESKLGK